MAIIEPIKNKNTKILKVFETFSGIGAQHKALEIIKKLFGYEYEIVGTSEWDVDAIISYAAIHYPEFNEKSKNPNEEIINDYLKNFSHSFSGKGEIDFSKIMQMDLNKKITYWKAHSISKNMGNILLIKGKELNKKIGDIDLITYSFPCQDLSIAGSLHGFNNGMAKNSNTRSGLLWQIGRILKELKSINKLPKFLLLENVANMISKKHKSDYIEWKKELKKIGYSTKTYVLNAKNYGLPQNRNRVYAISILGNYKVDKEFEILDKNIFPEKIEKMDEIKPINLKDVIKQNYKKKQYRDEAAEATPNRTKSRKLMFEKNYKLNDFDKYKYSRTVTTKQDRHPNAGIINLNNSILSNDNNKQKANYRFITPREAYLLMGFTEKDFNNIKKLNLIKKEKLYQQAGNSIAVSTIAHVLKIIQELNNKEV
ncbi:MAG: DNA (cytosine-5-)-methyltransferase [Metamycoplasmataceae bacterium]